MGILAAKSVSLAGLWLQLGMTLLILLLFAGLAFLAVRYLKPGLKMAGNTSRMRIVSRLPLSPRAQIFLVQLDERELIVGVTDNQMTLLVERDAPQVNVDE
ncbi:MAG: flagellar biosynthetic protein FliO [Deltaproteobacteria bacterium]|nr:flagellar biosynthetic protein FliO [Deltaproteobacteria bacterium]